MSLQIQSCQDWWTAWQPEFYPPDPPWWKKRTKSHKLSSDLHVYTVARAHTHTLNIHVKGTFQYKCLVGWLVSLLLISLVSVWINSSRWTQAKCSLILERGQDAVMIVLAPLKDKVMKVTVKRLADWTAISVSVLSFQGTLCPCRAPTNDTSLKVSGRLGPQVLVSICRTPSKWTLSQLQPYAFLLRTFLIQLSLW